jgi:hypothetical protein
MLVGYSEGMIERVQHNEISLSERCGPRFARVQASNVEGILLKGNWSVGTSRRVLAGAIEVSQSLWLVVDSVRAVVGGTTSYEYRGSSVGGAVEPVSVSLDSSGEWQLQSSIELTLCCNHQLSTTIQTANTYFLLQ